MPLISELFPPVQPHTNVNGSSSAFKPYGNATPPIPPSFSGSSVAPPIPPSFPGRTPIFPPAPQNLDHVSYKNMRTTVIAPHAAHSNWAAGSSPAYPSDIVDLMAERNILQEGFDDIEYTLPHNMANNTARVDPRYESCTEVFLERYFCFPFLFVIDHLQICIIILSLNVLAN
ncbi:unnamed protein product [Strongylus vulgaris]|uniref:Uncharacterized protein n=1 Tax=Strongylus vulgaris TaxID=40348 RepID=A0A3P7JF09_STRVU|nr:unnamed protein product [Strongylus vulgaris]